LGVGPVLVGLVVAFVVAFASIAWLLRFVASNTLIPFVWYRVGLGLVLMGVLAAGVISAT
jgi:undecaprenyl-diphosphatase